MGLSAAIILRPTGAGYEVVGEAYIVGIMEGRAWPVLEDDS